MRALTLRHLCLAALAVLITGAFSHAQAGWQMAPPLPKAVGEIAGAVVGSKWYVMAGLDPATHRPLGLVYAFDPASQQWSQRKGPPEPAHHVMVAPLDGKIYVFGGFVHPSSSDERTAET